jgi:Fur family zinc uptake transcriptional regulator
MTDQASLTRNQAMVLDTLRDAGRPLSAYQILDQTASQGVKAPPQVYRALEKLAAFGLVHRIESLNAYTFCDHGPHAGEVAFAICEACGAVAEIPLAELAPALAAATAARGFGLGRAQIELRGTCEACLAGSGAP